VLLDVQMPEMDGFDIAEAICRDLTLKSPAVMMLTSLDLVGATARCRQLGIRSYLVKPVSPADLRRAIGQCLGAERRDAGQPATADLDEHPVSLRVLLAEDNLVNQTLAQRLLERRGHRVWTAINGEEAVRLHQSHEFDVVVMDVQMPVLDGLEATAAIRAAEHATGRLTPIIAMTAHAMKGDRERCLEAGMDAYITKPIDSHELIWLVEQLGAGFSAAHSPAEPEPATHHPSS
jgi:CheY-like chemotaxis protein